MPDDRFCCTTDTLLHGRLVLRQPARGHRVNLDAILLAAFAATVPAPGPGTRRRFRFPRAADLGAGTGAVALLLCKAGLVRHCTCIEIEPALAEIARSNAAANGMARAVDVLAADLRHSPPPDLAGKCDLVVANPPYLPLATGHTSPDPLRAAARHEVYGGLPEFAAAARALLRPHGAFALIYPWRRHGDARRALADAGFAVVRERRHRPQPSAPPTTFCWEARLGPGTDTPAVEELVVHCPGGGFSADVERFLDGNYAFPSAARIAESGTTPARTTR